jgi:hypothetical protein
MRRFLTLALLAAAPLARAQAPAAPATLRSTLLYELHSTHDHAQWFTPINTAVAGLTPEQARWIPTNAAGHIDPANNHSAGMLAFHLWYWNARALARLRGQDPDKATGKYAGNNDATFNDFNAATWDRTVHDLDTVMDGIEDWVAHATDEQLAKSAPTIANICTHNAYHTGQILYVRKLQGSWNPANGVK